MDRELNKPVAKTNLEKRNLREDKPFRKTSVNTAEVERLEQMMNVMNQPDEGDSEIQQLNGMLDKILDVQHPERVQQKLEQVSNANRKRMLSVSSHR